MKWNIKKNEEKLEKDTNDGIIGLEEKIEGSRKWTIIAIVVAIVIAGSIAGILAAVGAI